VPGQLWAGDNQGPLDKKPPSDPDEEAKDPQKFGMKLIQPSLKHWRRVKRNIDNGAVSIDDPECELWEFDIRDKWPQCGDM
jgi:hypothetical protein